MTAKWKFNVQQNGAIDGLDNGLSKKNALREWRALSDIISTRSTELRTELS